jgi:hypothetical protein
MRPSMKQIIHNRNHHPSDDVWTLWPGPLEVSRSETILSQD